MPEPQNKNLGYYNIMNKTCQPVLKNFAKFLTISIDKKFKYAKISEPIGELNGCE